MSSADLCQVTGFGLSFQVSAQLNIGAENFGGAVGCVAASSLLVGVIAVDQHG